MRGSVLDGFFLSATPFPMDAMVLGLVLVDLVDEFGAIRRLGPLVSVWSLQRTAEVEPLVRALGERGIEAYPRAFRAPEFVRPLESAAPLRWVARLRRSNRFRGERGGGCRSAARRITGRRTTPASGSPDVIWEPHEHARVGAKLVGRRHTKSGARTTQQFFAPWMPIGVLVPQAQEAAARAFISRTREIEMLAGA